jgi:hypothetical protein
MCGSGGGTADDFLSLAISPRVTQSTLSGSSECRDRQHGSSRFQNSGFKPKFVSVDTTVRGKSSTRRVLFNPAHANSRTDPLQPDLGHADQAGVRSGPDGLSSIVLQ